MQIVEIIWIYLENLVLAVKSHFTYARASESI
jgi:hypothetical protein